MWEPTTTSAQHNTLLKRLSFSPIIHPPYCHSPFFMAILATLDLINQQFLRTNVFLSPTFEQDCGIHHDFIIQHLFLGKNKSYELFTHKQRHETKKNLKGLNIFTCKGRTTHEPSLWQSTRVLHRLVVSPCLLFGNTHTHIQFFICLHVPRSGISPEFGVISLFGEL